MSYASLLIIPYLKSPLVSPLCLATRLLRSVIYLLDDMCCVDAGVTQHHHIYISITYYKPYIDSAHASLTNIYNVILYFILFIYFILFFFLFYFFILFLLYLIKFYFEFYNFFFNLSCNF